MADVPAEAVEAAARVIIAGLSDRYSPQEFRDTLTDLTRSALAAAAPAIVAEQVKAHRAEQDAMHADLSLLLRTLGMGDHARPQSSHEVMLEAIAGVARLRDAARRVLANASDPRGTMAVGASLRWLQEAMGGTA